MGSLAPPPTTSLAPGDRLDRYELLCVLAHGGMGTVWLGRMTGKHGFERLVAVKTILASYGTDRQFVDMFLDEARIASQVDHENVARILEIGEDRGVLYHAMELVDGESLRKLYRDIRNTGDPFPLPIALRIASDLCAGLHAVHELRGADGAPLDVVHRDVSPQNVLVTLRGTVKLIDFGVAKARERRTEATNVGVLKGKIEYMAPEQANGEKVDRRADVYGVGALLYELLAGAPVRSTEEGRQLLALHELMSGAPYAPLPAAVPDAVRVLVDRALSLEPASRFATADELRRALEQAMVSLGHHATTDDVATVLGRYSRERTAKRKSAIDAVVRAAAAPATASAATAEEGRTLLTEPSLEPLLGLSGPGRTRVMSVAEHASTRPGPLPSERASNATGPHLAESALGTGPLPLVAPSEAPGTAPSLRTMHGASMSGAPPAPSGIGRVVGAAAVLALVAVLGILVGVAASRGRASDPTVVLAQPSTPTPSLSPVPVPVPGSAPASASASASAPASAPASASASAPASASIPDAGPPRRRRRPREDATPAP